MPHPPTRSAPDPASWRQSREIALYPLRGDALLALAVLTGFGVLAWLPGIGWLLAIVAYFCGYKYAFEILLATANGRQEAPEVALEAQDEAVWRLLGVLLVLLAAIRLAILADMEGIAWLALAVFALVQPSLLASLATGNGLAEALNPANAARMLGRIGPPYLGVAAALFLIQCLFLLAATTVVPLLPRFVAALLVDVVFYWGLFASFHLLGRVLYRYHAELGFTPARHTDRLPTLHDRDEAVLGAAAVRIADNDLPGAIGLLQAEMRERSVTPPVHERYRLLLRQAGDSAALDAHAGSFIAMLAHERQDRRALALLHEALDANPAFARLDPDHGEWLARRALDLGQFRLAADAWRALLRADPRHPAATQWAMQAAQLLHERFGDTRLARATLQSARDACREASGAARLDAALAALPAPLAANP